MKNDTNATDFEGFQSGAGRASLGQKVGQNFSNAGGRLTSIEGLNNLNLRDNILTSFSVNEAKHSTLKMRSRSMFKERSRDPTKENAFIVRLPMENLDRDSESGRFKPQY